MDDQLSVQPAQKKWSFGPKIIFGLIAVILIVEAIYAFKTFSKPLPPPLPKIQPISGGKIVLISPKKEYKTGEIVPVSVKVVTGGHSTQGTDLILKYDPAYFEATPGAALKGTTYPDYPNLSVDQKTGSIAISGIAGVSGKTFNGIDIFANIKLKAQKAGSTSLKVDFVKDLTTDSNIVDSTTGTDILEEVFNLDLIIK